MKGLSSSIFLLRRRLMPSPSRMSSQSHSGSFLFTSMVAKKKSYQYPNNLCNLPHFMGLFVNHHEFFAHFSGGTLSNSSANNETSTGKRIDQTGLQVEIISEENIKPASPTPDHLRTYEVSVLDQLFPNIYMPFVYFYQNNNQNNDHLKFRRQLLKRSLLEILPSFYPLAGKVKNNRQIDCNDDGVYYVEAKVNTDLSDFLKQPNLKSIHKFLPMDPNSLELLFSQTYLVMIQVTVFDCGGIAIGLYTSHKIMDGSSHATFLKAWAAAAHGESSNSIVENISPSFISPSIFPSNPVLPEDATLVWLPPLSKPKKRATKRFLFGSSSIINLKKKAAAPSRVTAVTGLLWKCVMAASKNNYCDPVIRSSILLMLVNLRDKSLPPMPNYSIGNIIWPTTPTKCIPCDDDLELDSIVQRLQNAIDEINSDFIEKMKREEFSLKVGELLNEMRKFYLDDQNIELMYVTSMCNTGIYEAADFGWGNPIWVSVGNADADHPLLANVVMLMDTRSGKGIEAWVTLSEEEMAVLEKDPELLAFASSNPSPLETDD